MEREVELAYEIQPATEADMALVWNSWLKSYRCEPESQRMPARAYHLWQKDIVQRLLDGGARVYVARDAERPVFLFGWLCAQRVGDALACHYAFVKRSFRERGVGHALLAAAVDQLGDGASELWQTHSSAEHGERLRAMGFVRVPVERLLHEPREAA